MKRKNIKVENTHADKLGVGVFWDGEEINFFNCIKKIEQSNLFIGEKKYYIFIAEILFKHTHYFKEFDNLKNFWENKKKII